jgi:hypothetical protein
VHSEPHGDGGVAQALLLGLQLIQQLEVAWHYTPAPNTATQQSKRRGSAP